MKCTRSRRCRRSYSIWLLLGILLVGVLALRTSDAAEMLPDLITWADEDQNFLYGWYLDTNQIAGHTLLRISSAVPNIGVGPLEMIGSSESPDVYQRIYLSEGGYTDRYAGSFTFHPTHGHLHYDNWMRFNLRYVLTNNAVGDLVVAGAKSSSAILDVQHYDSSLPGSPNSSQYFGGYTQGISVGWADVYGATLDDQWIDVTGVPDGHYWLEQVVDPENNIKESNETNNTTRILIDLFTKPPSNDHFTNAFVINGITAGIYGGNVQGTKEAGEPFHFASTGGASSWYRWTAPSNMNVAITTKGSSFDTLLAVYVGSAVNALTLITNNDDVAAGDTSSRVTFSATNGVTYRIAVDGFGSPPDNGSFQINFNPALNDNFANALTITGNSGATSGSNRGATRQGGEPNHAGVSGNDSIWFTWTATVTGPVVFDTLGSSFDTLLGIYVGNSVNSLSTIASDNNGGGAATSRLTFNATNGTTYRIAVDGANGSDGIVDLNWLGPALPTIAAQPGATNSPSGTTVGFRVIANSSSPLSYRWMFQGTNLTDNSSVSGATNSVLTLSTISTNNQGTYTVRISNSFGSITSAPANLIVLDNPRAVFVDEFDGHIGGVVRVPINMQALGNENALQFSLLFDPLVLTNARVSSNMVGTTIQIYTNQVSTGKLGVGLSLATNQAVAPGTREWAIILLDAVSTVPDHTITSIGFGSGPVTNKVFGTNGATLPTLFAAGQLTLHLVSTVQTGTRLPDGRYQLSLAGISGRTYVVQASTDLSTWSPLTTNQLSFDGSMQLIDNQSTNLPKRFYRALLLP